MLFITLFKIIIVIGSSTLPSAFFMGGSGFATKRGTGRALPFMPNFLIPLFCWMSSLTNKLSVFLSFMPYPVPPLTGDYILGKKSLIAFKQIKPKPLPVVYIFSLIKFIRIKSLNTKQCPAELAP